MDLFLSADEYIPMDSQCRDLALQSDYLTAGDIGYVLRTEAIKRILSGSLTNSKRQLLAYSVEKLGSILH
jgi:hypothetical protein